MTRTAGPRTFVVATLALAFGIGITSSNARLSAVGGQQAEDNGIQPSARAQIEALIREKETRSPAEQKIDSQLLYARRMQLGLPVAPGVQTIEVDIPYADDGHAIVDVKARLSSRLLAQMNAVTGEAKQTGDADLQLHVDLAQLDTIAADPDVIWVAPKRGAYTSRQSSDKPAGAPRLSSAERRTRTLDELRAAIVAPAMAADATRPPLAPMVVGPGTGSVSSQADVTHRSAVFRGLTGITGAGVKIGVLSDGVQHLADAQASGDLGAVTVLPGQTGSGDEGTAMLELIHDMAPGAQLYFATAFTSITSFADNIRALRTAGCDIIVDDVGYYVESPFQDGQGVAVISPTNGGVVTQAVKDVAALGAMYFSSAGNSGNLNDGTSGVWEGDFNLGAATVDPPIPAAGAGNFHRFTGVQDFNTLTVAGSGPVALFWSDPLGASGNDYDLFRLNTAGTAVAASSTNIQNGNDDPYEQMSNSTASPRIVIVKKTGAAARFLHLNTNRGQLSVATAGQIHGHAATSNIFTFGVAAAYTGFAYPNPFSTSNVIETFSSDGPRRVFFLGDGTAVTPGNFSSSGGAVLQKPDLTAGDGSFVTGAGDFAGQFFGTSAAAPNAAAIMALIKSQHPGFTQTQLRSALFATALDIEAAGVDRDSGIGIVMAQAPQPGCTFVLAPAAPSASAIGGTGTLTVTASSGSCNWVVFSNVPWLNVIGTGVGTGNGSVGYTVNPNHGPARAGTMMVQGGSTITVTQTGASATTFDNVTPLGIPDNTTVESSITVSGVTGQITNLTAAFYITHTFDADLTISLVGPDGTVVPLSVENGGSANNYGSACSPVTSRTTFDDGTATLVTHGSAPFTGVFRPEKPLAAFNGKGGVAANGTWKLRIQDSFAGDTGTLNCWSLNVNQGSNPLSADFDGDTRADMALYKSNGDWAILKSSSNFTSSLVKSWGGAGYTAAPGDYDGDGIQDLGLYRESTGDWLVLKSSTNFTTSFSINWGGAGYKPEPGDYDGDGKTDPTVYNTATGTWSALKSSTSYTTVIGVSWGGAGFTPVPGQDFDGDSKSDMVVYAQATGVWSILKSSTNFTTASSIGWGGAGYMLVPGDYDGDGKADPGIYNKASGAWNILLSASNYVTSRTINWGGTGYLPVPGDFDGDRRTDAAIFQTSTGNWSVLKSSSDYTTAINVTGWGSGSDLPVSAAINVGGSDTTRATDYDGDAKSEMTVYNSSTGVWSILKSSAGYTTALSVGLGGSGYAPMPGDFDGDGKTDVAVYQSTTGNWYVLLSSTSYTTSLSKNAGGTGWAPVPADYDGDGKTDFAVYNTSSGIWFVLKSSTNYTTSMSVSWGGSGYIAEPADFDGDGKADLALYQSATGNWFVLLSGAGFTTTISKSVGGAGYLPVAADYDGDGKADFVVYNSTSGLWFGLKSSTGFTTSLSASWGGTGYLAIRGDYDGDGKTDLAIYQPSSGNWYVLLSASGYTTSLSKSWGGAAFTGVPNYLYP